MNRYFIKLAYNGTKYHGWQYQPNAITVQEVLEKALSLKLNSPIKVVGAGRTDTGVHAEYFIAHFDYNKLIDSKVVYGLNNILPDDVVVFDIFKVNDNSHARFDAIERTYEYRISKERNPFLNEITTFVNSEFDIELLNKASKVLLTHNDFTSFSKLHSDNKTNICNVTFASWEEIGNNVIFKITADRFLRNMVRAIVGTLLDVNKAKLSVQDFDDIIAHKDRSKAGKSAEPQGLFLTNIKYDYF